MAKDTTVWGSKTTAGNGVLTQGITQKQIKQHTKEAITAVQVQAPLVTAQDLQALGKAISQWCQEYLEYHHATGVTVESTVEAEGVDGVKVGLKFGVERGAYLNAADMRRDLQTALRGMVLILSHLKEG